jgi:hypothetical protein
MSVILRTKRSSTSGNTPSNLELGELAVNIIDKKIWIGTGSEPPVLLSEPLTVKQLIAGDGISINTNNEINLDLSGLAPITINAYSLTLTNANILDFSSDDATISGVSRIESGVDNTVYIQGNLIVSGYIETDTGIKGNTNDDSEYLGIGMEIDGGTW